MLLGPVVDVAIGLIFVYLLLGLITTAFQEVLSRVLQLRGKGLHDALAALLTNGDKSDELFKAFCGHALVRGTATSDRPSYIPSRNFALALIDVLNDDSQAPIFSQVENKLSGMPDGYAKASLKVFVAHAGGDLDALKTSLARWYDDAMDRLSGDYKRFSQTIALLCGLFFAVALNVDSIRIVEVLWTNDSLRSHVADVAADTVQKAKGTLPDPNGQLTENINQLGSLGLPIGWPALKTKSVSTSGQSSNPVMVEIDGLELYFGTYFGNLHLGGTILVVIGWLMTTLATSLGAPFWFDTLQRFLQLRSTGPKPLRADAPAPSSGD